MTLAGWLRLRDRFFGFLERDRGEPSQPPPATSEEFERLQRAEDREDLERTIRKLRHRSTEPPP